MTDAKKKPHRITDTLTKPDAKTTEEEREAFLQMVRDLGRNKFYPNMKYKDSVGNETTVAEELAHVRKAYSKSNMAEVRDMAKLSDPELLQSLRKRGEALLGVGDAWDLELIRNRQPALDSGTGS